jgi:hypothetical protein
VNGDAEIRALAKLAYDGADLRHAYHGGRTLLESRGRAAVAAV